MGRCVGDSERCARSKECRLRCACVCVCVCVCVTRTGMEHAIVWNAIMAGQAMPFGASDAGAEPVRTLDERCRGVSTSIKHECLCPHARAQSLLFVYRCSNTRYTCNIIAAPEAATTRAPRHAHTSTTHDVDPPTSLPNLHLKPRCSVTPPLPHHHPAPAPQKLTPRH